LQALAAFFMQFCNLFSHQFLRAFELAFPLFVAASADATIPMKHSTVANITNLVGMIVLLLLVGF
jgi:hypothetical protein